jgi:hypothetical protein
VGDELGVCAGRVWQLRRKACAGMRAALAERGIDAGEFKKGSVPKSAAPVARIAGIASSSNMLVTDCWLFVCILLDLSQRKLGVEREQNVWRVTSITFH